MRVLCCFMLTLFLVSPVFAQHPDSALAARFNDYVAATKGQDPAKVADFYTDDTVLFDAGECAKAGLDFWLVLLC